jgi:hypothetical protein
MCLDIFNGGDSNNQPQLRPCSDVTGQAWTLTRTDTAVEGFAAEKEPGRAPAKPPSGCKPDQVYSSSMGQCIPKHARSGTKVFILHGCPYNLDKACIRTPGGALVQCHCVS